MVVIRTSIEARPEKRKELSQTLRAIVADVRKVGGCRQAACYQDVENDLSYLVLEEWPTLEEAEAHLGSEIFTVLRGAAGLMRRPPEIEVLAITRAMEWKA